LELQSHTQSKGTKEIYCTCKQGDKEAVTLFRFRCRLKLQTNKPTKRQRFKKLFRLELAKAHTKQTGQSGKGLKIVSLGTAKPHKATKEIYCTCKVPNK
jgi:hypothetical protein